METILNNIVELVRDNVITHGELLEQVRSKLEMESENLPNKMVLYDSSFKGFGYSREFYNFKSENEKKNYETLEDFDYNEKWRETDALLIKKFGEHCANNLDNKNIIKIIKLYLNNKLDEVYRTLLYICEIYKTEYNFMNLIKMNYKILIIVKILNK